MIKLRPLTETFEFDFRTGKLSKTICGYKNSVEYTPPIEERYVFHAFLKFLSPFENLYSRGCLLPIERKEKEGVTKALQGIWFYNEQKNYLLPFQFFVQDDTYIKDMLELIKVFHSNSIECKWFREVWSMHFLNSMHMQNLSIGDKEIKLTLTRNIKILPHIRGHYCMSLPLPGPDPKAPGIEIVASSEYVRDNLNEICKYLHLDLKTIFISGDPGIGKEAYSNLIHYGIGKKGPLKKVDMTSPRDEVELRLMGKITETGDFIPGFFEEAENGTIIFDELDKLTTTGKKAQERDLSYLLRPLDPGSYYPKNGHEEKIIEKVTFVFVGTKSTGELQKLLDKPNQKKMKKSEEYPITPPDFFTRVSYPEVHLQHPLPKAENQKGEVSKEKKKSIIDSFKYLVRYFYWQEVERKSRLEAGLEKNILEKNILEKNIDPYRLDCIIAGEFNDDALTAAEKYYKALVKKWVGQNDFEIIKNMEFEISDLIKYTERPSIRQIRNVVFSFVMKYWEDERIKKEFILKEFKKYLKETFKFIS